MADSKRTVVDAVRNFTMKLAHQHLRRLHKKSLLIIGVSVILIGVIGYVAWSKQVWDGYQSHYTQWQQAIGASTQEASALPVATPAERATVVDRLAAITKHIQATSTDACEVSPFAQWQETLIAALKAKRATCQAMTKKLAEFRGSLVKTVEYAKADAALSTVLTFVPQSDELSDDAAISAQLAAWTKAADTVSKLTVSTEFKPIQQLALKQMTDVKAAWQEVIAANQAKDKKRYLAAQDKLAATLDGLDEISLTSQKAAATLTSKLKVTAAAAFDS